MKRRANDMSIKLAEANRAIQAALTKAHNLALTVCVTVCDAEGRLVALQRMDGAYAEACRESIGKAIASANSGRASGDEPFEGWEHSRVAMVVAQGAPLIRRRGGLPIIRAGQVEGALGIGGAYGNTRDGECEECALVGIGAIEEKDNASTA
jgi:glc operon protein GlcG